MDQIGTAYGIEIESGTIAWRIPLDPAESGGGNTSSPCYVEGKLVFGTVTGHLHWIRVEDGKHLHAEDLGWPIVSPVTSSRGNVYVSALDGSVTSYRDDGVKRWSGSGRRRLERGDG